MDREAYPILHRHWPSNVVRFPGTRPKPVMPEECQALWHDAVAKTEEAQIAHQRFQLAFQSLSLGKDGAA